MVSFDDLSFRHEVVKFKGVSISIVIDEDGPVSVTNGIEYLSWALSTNDIIYRDTEGRWDGWNTNSGWVFLNVEGNPSPEHLMNLYILKKRLKGNYERN